ncbi:MAG: aminoglycoside phosphotransferase family protein [Christensenellaceae bacterium]|jgi:N-acetylhexosamine 1-kinase|nr:aminoglycoside phosphotransferase family protein [Christensenellaceae bacterium]
MITNGEILDILSAFAVKGEVKLLLPCGNGHINDTYKLDLTDGRQFILQRINDKVFPNVEGLMQNIASVTKYMAAQKAESFEVLHFYTDNDGKAFTKTESGFFRMYDYVDNVISVETAPTEEQLKISGVGFGKFQKILSGFPASELSDTIPDFHNTYKRLQNLIAAAQADKFDRLKFVKKECEFFLDRARYAEFVITKDGENLFPLRVTHNDTKLNNILIDPKTNTPRAVIDLDTVMRGSVLYDFGDSIRFGANTAAEDERDLDKVQFSLPHFRAFTEGFLGEVKDALTQKEIESLSFGAILMTYECGARFLTDYLNGDTYFKTHRPGHNVDRCRTQIKLVKEMEANIAEMTKIACSI